MMALAGIRVNGEIYPKDSVSYLLSSKFQTGFILYHKDEIVRFTGNAPFNLQLDFSILKNTIQSWDYCNCYSKNGVSFNYSNFGNKESLGRALSVVFFVEPYLKVSPRHQISFRAGAGPVYLNKVFDEIANPDNFFYSMPLSYLITLNANLYLSISPSTRLSLTAQFNHISNGGTRTPNYGMNFPAAGFGVEHSFNKINLSPKRREPFTNHHSLVVVQAFSGPRIAKGYDPLPEVHKLFFGLNAGVVKPLGRISAIGVGAEWYYDPISKVYEERKGQRFETNIVSAGLQHYLFFGKAFFAQQLSYYVTPHNSDIKTPIYQRYTLGYKISKHFFAGVNLKTHLEVADHAGFTTGIIF
jgi:hypothetical protein